MRNNYQIDGDLTTIFVKKRNGDVHEVLIDTEDLPILLEHNRSICTKKSIHGKEFYAYTTQKDWTKHIYLHRLLMNPPNKYVVDHINKKPLDNRKENLRITTQRLNTQYKKTQSNNTSTGVRGVTKVPSGRYAAVAKIDGKVKHIGTYDTMEEAKKVVERARRKIELQLESELAKELLK